MALLNLVFGLRGERWSRTFIAFVVILSLHGLLNTFGVNLVELLLERLGLVAPRRRGDHRRSCWSSCPTSTRALAVDVHRVPQRDRVAAARSTSSSSGCSWRSTPSPGTTPPRTSRRRPRTPPSRRRRGSSNSVVGLARRRLDPAHRGHFGDPGLRRLTARHPTSVCRRRRSSSTPLAGTLGMFLLFICAVAQFFCGMASRDLRTRGCPSPSPVTTPCRARACGPRSTRAPAPRPTRSGSCTVASIVLACPALVEPRRPTSPSPRSPSSASTSPTSRRSSCGGRNPDFRPGRWNLGRWSALIGWIAVVWVAFIVVLFMLPPASPITVDTFNYAPIAVLVVLGLRHRHVVPRRAGSTSWSTSPRVTTPSRPPRSSGELPSSLGAASTAPGCSRHTRRGVCRGAGR